MNTAYNIEANGFMGELGSIDWVPTANNPGLHELMVRLSKTDAHVLMTYESNNPDWIAINVVPAKCVEMWSAQDEAYALTDWLERQCEILFVWLHDATEDNLRLEVFFDEVDTGDIEDLLDESHVTVTVSFTMNALRNCCALRR